MWTTTFLLTLLFFLISLGIGLFILGLASMALIEKSRLTRLQLIVLGFIIGGPGTGVCLQLLSLISNELHLELGVVAFVSLLGFLMTRRAWYPQHQNRNEIAAWLALSLPMALVTWWWTFGAFSHYPYGDIGADVHWIKTAQEFANTGVLNPYASQSYTDIRPALAGALCGTLGLDLLQFNWLYRYFSVLFFLIVFYTVADSVFFDPRRKWLAFFLAAASNELALVTNGSLAVAGSFVFLGALLKCDLARTKTCSPSILPSAGAALVGLLLAYFINNNMLMLASLVLVSILSNVSSRMGDPARRLTANIFVGLTWSLALMFVHRGSYLFIPIAVAGSLFYIAVSKIISSGAPFLTRTLWTFALLLPLICVGILACLIMARLGYLPSLDANKAFSYVTVLILGKEIKNGEEINLGAGPEIAAIEIGRAIGPFFALGIGFVFVWWYNMRRTARLAKFVSFEPAWGDGNDSAARLLWSWIAGCGLSLAVLSGFPFLYRTVFLISGFFTIAATEIFGQVFVSSAKRRHAAAIVVTVGIVVLVFGLYAVSWRPNLAYSGYQAIFRSSEVAAVAIVIAFAALTLTKSRQVQIIGLAAVIGLSVTIDRSGISTLFRVYSYGRLPDGGTVVSHYNGNDLKAAFWLRANMNRAILISDPYTLGMATAITGFPALYLFSNLDTVNRAIASRVKASIGSIVDSISNENAVLRTCSSLSVLLANLNQEAYFQVHHLDSAGGIFKPIRIEHERSEEDMLKAAEPQSTDDVKRQMEILATSQGNWNVVAIINPRTLEWMHSSDDRRISYFPPETPLAQEVATEIENGPFHALYSDGYSSIVVIECGKDKIPSNNKPL
jgi:hypothetical protein